MEFIKVTTPESERGRKYIALVELNRPKELNALNLQLMQELKEALLMLDMDDSVRVIVLTGNEKAFAAGADIKQMANKTAVDMLRIDQFSTWDQIRKTRKPLIAGVSGLREDTSDFGTVPEQKAEKVLTKEEKRIAETATDFNERHWGRVDEDGTRYK